MSASNRKGHEKKPEAPHKVIISSIEGRDPCDRLDRAACALFGVQYLLEGHRNHTVHAEQVSHILDVIIDVIIDSVDDWKSERAERGEL